MDRWATFNVTEFYHVGLPAFSELAYITWELGSGVYR